MRRIDALREAVQSLYVQKQPERADWCDWMYEHHVFLVASNAKRLAEKYEADVDLAEAAALLHDIADAIMPRSNPKHEEESLRIARKLLSENGYNTDEIALVVDDAILLHSCHNGQQPKSKEGLILATADSMAHLQSDFYPLATLALGQRNTSIESMKQWVLQKIERDLNAKISFDDEREAARHSYDIIKELYSRESSRTS